MERMGIKESELDYYLTEILKNNNAEKLVEERMNKWRMEQGKE